MADRLPDPSPVETMGRQDKSAASMGRGGGKCPHTTVELCIANPLKVKEQRIFSGRGEKDNTHCVLTLAAEAHRTQSGTAVFVMNLIDFKQKNTKTSPHHTLAVSHRYTFIHTRMHRNKVQQKHCCPDSVFT